MFSNYNQNMNSVQMNSMPSQNTMQPQPFGVAPPLYPDYRQQNVNPFPQYNQQQAMYAKGGHVGLGDLAEKLRSQGEGEDTILAHINPSEAKMLHRKFGSDINPETGLPQFGWAKKVFRNKFSRKFIPIAASIIGNMMGGPMGGTIGGAIGKGITSKNPLKGGLKGGIYAAAANYGIPAAARMFGMNEIPGLGHRGLKGMGGLGGMFGSGGEGAGPQFGGMSGLGSLFGGGNKQPGSGGGGMGGLGNILLATSVLGTLMGKKKGATEEQSLDDFLTKQEAKHLRDTKYRATKPMSRSQAAFDPERFKTPQPEFNYFPDEENVEYMATGGYMHGGTGGQDDKIKAMLSDGEYVIDASTVSDLGDGNNAAGAKKLDEMRKRIRMHKRTGGNKLPAKVKGLSHYLKGV